jgi:hypothetical protein
MVTKVKQLAVAIMMVNKIYFRYSETFFGYLKNKNILHVKLTPLQQAVHHHHQICHLAFKLRYMNMT